MSERLYQMQFSKVYEALVNKVIRKGGKEDDVAYLTALLTGYSVTSIADACRSDLTYGDFFRQAPQYHDNRTHITGVICGVRIEEITEPILQEIRRLDKLVDWLAKGKSVEEIIAKYDL